MSFTIRTAKDLEIELEGLKITVAPLGFKDGMFAADMLLKQQMTSDFAYQCYLALSRIRSVEGVNGEDGEPFKNWDLDAKMSFFGDNPKLLNGVVKKLLGIDEVQAEAEAENSKN